MVMQHGRRVRVDYVENDHCCQRFALADGWLRARGLQAEGFVGHATARLARARMSSALRLQRCGGSPRFFLHGPEEGCVECDAARCGA
jgi:aminoglycoside N3'-acetyltransferase